MWTIENLQFLTMEHRMTEKLYKHAEKRYFTGINIHMVIKLHVYKLKKQLYFKRDKIFIRSINWVNFHNMSQRHCFCCKSSYPSITVQEIQHKCLKTALEMYTGYMMYAYNFVQSDNIKL